MSGHCTWLVRTPCSFQKVFINSHRAFFPVFFFSHFSLVRTFCVRWLYNKKSSEKKGENECELSNCQTFQILEKSSQSYFSLSRKVRNDRFTVSSLNFNVFLLIFDVSFPFCNFLHHNSTIRHSTVKSLPNHFPFSLCFLHIFAMFLPLFVSALTLPF